MSAETQGKKPAPKDVVPSSLALRKTLEQLVLQETWEFGPFQFWLKTGPNQLAVAWERDGREPDVGRFVEQGRNWAYHDHCWEPGEQGSPIIGGTIRSLLLIQLDPQDNVNPKGIVSLTYSIDPEGLLNFSTTMPDMLGHNVSLRSPLTSPVPSSWFEVDSWPRPQEYVRRGEDFALVGTTETFALVGQGYPQKAGQPPLRSRPFSFQPTIPLAAVKRWLTMSHLRNPNKICQDPDVLRMFRLDQDTPEDLGFLAPTWLEPQTRNKPLHDLAASISDDVVGWGETLFYISTEVLPYLIREGVWDMEETMAELDMVIALTLLTHPGRHWFVQADDLDPRTTNVLVAPGFQDNLTTNGPSIISGKPRSGISQEVSQTILSATGNAWRKIVVRDHDRDVALNNPELSISPVFICNGYVDLTRSQPTLVVPGIVFVANPDGKFTFSWASEENMAPLNPPRLMPLEQLRSAATLQAFRPTDLVALGQTLALASRMGPDLVHRLLIEELGLRLEPSS
jgi:hypothetical protein